MAANGSPFRWQSDWVRLLGFFGWLLIVEYCFHVFRFSCWRFFMIYTYLILFYFLCFIIWSHTRTHKTKQTTQKYLWKNKRLRTGARHAYKPHSKHCTVSICTRFLSCHNTVFTGKSIKALIILFYLFSLFSSIVFFFVKFSKFQSNLHRLRLIISFVSVERTRF